MDDLDSFGARGFNDRRHLVGQRTAPFRGAFAPMLVPHIANDDCHFRDRNFFHQRHFIPHTAPFERFHARAQFEFDGSFGPEPERRLNVICQREKAA